MMEPFVRHTGRLAALGRANVDPDPTIPRRSRNRWENGLLPVRVLPQEMGEVFGRHQAAGGEYQLTVDLEEQRVHDGLGFRTTFSMELYRREMLLHGLDEIGRTLRFEDRIGAYEEGRAGSSTPSRCFPATGAGPGGVPGPSRCRRP